jgi:CheY-like chemotaxis protein
MNVTATNGHDAIELLDSNPDLSLILMDVMMPEMDGYETMRRIARSDFRLPIISLTAKAMKGDREKCLQARPTMLPSP